MIRPNDYWCNLEGIVTAKVDAALRIHDEPRGPLIAYLRNLETMVRTEYGRQQTIQVIASGRRLLGDRAFFRSPDVPFVPGYAHPAGALDALDARL